MLIIVCPICGQTFLWDDTEKPFEKCSFCNFRLSYQKNGELYWKSEVKIYNFGVPTDLVLNLRSNFIKNFNPSRRGKEIGKNL